MCDCYTCACSASTWNNLCLASKVLQRRNETHHLPICRKLGSCRSNGRILVRIWKMQNLKNLGSVFGPILGPFWGLRAPFWVHLGVSGSLLGLSWGPLVFPEAFLGTPSATWRPFVHALGQNGSHWRAILEVIFRQLATC